jgi:hypothetical protein
MVMTRRAPYALVYAPETLGHVAFIDSKYHSLIEKTIAEKLCHGSTIRTRNRKPLDDIPGPFASTWELRFGPDNRFRVFYEPVEDEKTVYILAIGVKDRDRLIIAGKDYLS